MDVVRRCSYYISRSIPKFQVMCDTKGYSTSTPSPSPAVNVDDVVFTEVGSKRVIELNRPKALNALSLPMIHMMYPKMMQWEHNPDIKLVILKGNGEKAFCAGGDVRSLVESIERGETALTEAFYRDEYKLDYLIGTYDIPFVAFIDGIVMGGGVGISVHGAFRVATEKSLFAMPETAIGLFPDVGGGYFLPRLQGKVGLFLALTGYRLKSRDLVEAGIATHYVNSKMLENELLLMKSEEVKKDNVRKVLDEYHEKSKESYTFSLWPHLQEINDCFSGKTVEQIIENLKGNGSDWAMQQVKTMELMSPTSMKITHRQLEYGGSMSLKDVLKMEYRLTQKIAQEGKDFVQGVRAVLIEKHGEPVWNPPTLEQVTNEKLDWYFEALPADKELTLAT